MQHCNGRVGTNYLLSHIELLPGRVLEGATLAFSVFKESLESRAIIPHIFTLAFLQIVLPISNIHIAIVVVEGTVALLLSVYEAADVLRVLPVHHFAFTRSLTLIPCTFVVDISAPLEGAFAMEFIIEEVSFVRLTARLHSKLAGAIAFAILQAAHILVTLR